MGLHTILLDPQNPKRIFIAISAAGAFRTDDGGKTWKPINRGLRSQYIPDPNAEVGHCVHRIALHPSRPDVLFMQKHWDVMRSDNAGDQWHEVSGNLPTDFGFPIDVHAHEPETIYVVPIKSDSEHYPPEGKLRVYRSRTGGNEWEALTKGLPQEDCYVNVLRDAMAVDRSIRAASTSAPPAGRFTPRPTAATTGRRSSAICRRSCRWKSKLCNAAAAIARRTSIVMVRVILPLHLRTLAQVDGEVELAVAGEPTQRTILDALGSPLPDAPRHDPRSQHATAAGVPAILRLQRRRLASIARRAAPLPPSRRGVEPFMVVGAIAGG